MKRHGLPGCLLFALIACSPASAQTPISPPLETASEYAVCQLADYATAPRFWARGEYVFWLIGTGKLTEIAKEAYQSDLYNSLLALGGRDFEDVAQTALGDNRTGFRFGGGYWFDDQQHLGIEAGFLYANRPSLDLTLGRGDRDPLARIIPNGDIVLERQRQFDPSFDNIKHPLLLLHLLSRLGLPVIDDRTRRELVIPYGDRNLANGSIEVEVAGKTFWMFDLIGRANLFQAPSLRVDGLLGYRHASYEDSLSIRSSTVTLSRPLLPGTRIETLDRAQTQNEYDGVLLGFDLEANSGLWGVALRPTVTIAQLNGSVQRDGGRLVTLPERRRLHFPGGTYLRDSEIGEFSTNQWTVIPEVALRGWLQISDCCRFTLGGSLLYFPDVVRASNQLEIGLDPDRTLPGRSSRLSSQLRQTPTPDVRSMFMTTMSAGLEFRY